MTRPTAMAPDASTCPVGQWQPIETAPKDGTALQLWHDGMWVPQARWGTPEHSCGEYGSYCDSCPSREGWVDTTFNYYLVGDEENPGLHSEEPTHWMPEPSAPEVSHVG